MNLLADIVIPTGWMSAPVSAPTVILLLLLCIWFAFVVHNSVSHGWGFFRSMLWFIPIAEGALDTAGKLYPPGTDIDNLIKTALQGAVTEIQKGLASQTGTGK